MSSIVRNFLAHRPNSILCADTHNRKPSAKRKFDTGFFDCDYGKPLEFDVEAITAELRRLGEDRKISDTERKARVREAFMICHTIPLLNMALEDYKADVC